MQVEKDLAEAAVVILAGVQVDLVAADARLLGVAEAAPGQALAIDHLLLDEADDALGRGRGLGRLGSRLGVFLFVGQGQRAQRLRQLRAVAVERDRLEPEPPRQLVRLVAILDQRRVRHVDRLRDRARNERLGRRHHANVALGREKALADAAAAAGAVEHRQVFGLEVGRPFERHRPTAVDVRGGDLRFGEAQLGQHVELGEVEPVRSEPQLARAELLAQSPLVEREPDVERVRERAFEPVERGGGEAALAQRIVVDPGGVLERAVADRVAHHVVDLPGGVAQLLERGGHGAIDDLEVAAAGELLELDQREVGLDAGGVAVHHQADRAGGRDHRGLGVAVAVLLAERERAVPRLARGADEPLVGARRRIERHRLDREPFVAVFPSVGGAAVVADRPEHRLAVLGELREGAELARQLGRGGVSDSGHERADRAADGAALVAVVGVARGHQERADIGEAQAQRAELVGTLGDLGRGELRHHHRNLERDRPQPDRVAERVRVEAAVGMAEGLQVQRRQVARRVIEEHVLRARVRGVDAARFGTRVPVVDRGVELHPRIGRGPGGVSDLFPQLARRHAFVHLAVGAADERPLAVLGGAAHERLGDAHRVVRVLPRDRDVGVRIPIGVVGGEIDRGVTLAGELDHPLDIVLGDQRLARGADRLAQAGVARRREAAVALVARPHDRVEALGAELRTGDQRGHLLLLDDLPVDELLDVGVIDVDDDHLGGAARGAARLDRSGGAIADLEEAHQPRGFAAAGERFALGAEAREVGAGARAVLEQPCLAHPQVHDAVVVD